MTPHIRRKSFFIALFFVLYFFWLFVFKHNKPLADIGISVFSMLAYLVTLGWIIHSYRKINDKQRYFWLFFAIGIGFLFISKLTTYFNHTPFEKAPHSPVEDMIRLVGYLFFFTGFIYNMKVIKSTLPMLRFLLNIIIVIIAVYSVTWYFIVNPMVEGNHEITHIGLVISSIYHVLNISLLFAAVCLIFITPRKQNKTSLYFIAVGFLIQVVGDFFYINHVKHVGDWLYLLWPMSVLLMGLGAVYAKEYPWNPNHENEKFEYKKYYLPLISAGTLLVMTFYNQLQETNMLQKGLNVTVLLLLIQQTITALENKSMFTKLKRLAFSDGNFLQDKHKKDPQNSEMAPLLKKIENLAHYDSLTELPNRNLFQKRLKQELKRVEEAATDLSLMYIDMDRFKTVNDSLGHDSGDLLLKQVAGRLQAAAPANATVARIGGDEFAIIVPDADTIRLEQLAGQILQKFEASFTIKGYELYSTPSIGISVFPEGGRTAGELLKSADAAMYVAKDEGKNKFKFFNPRLNELLAKKMHVETRLRRGLEDKYLSLAYQPQVDLRTDKIIGVEALIRWNDPELGSVPPLDFIPIAEETGLIEPIGRWVIKTACLQLKKWQKQGLLDVTMAVNVSIRQFQNPNFVHEVREILTETKVAPHYLKIEITESILQNINKTLPVLNELQALGIQIAIDDFGTGYSSLSYLKNLPINYLKIDKAFIDELTQNPDGPIVKTIIDMGRNMNFTVIAEGVESEEHASYLRENKCFIGQGYLFSKPLPAYELEQFFQQQAMKIS